MYVPTTPNPTSGYFIIVPRSRVHELDMTVDEALKYVISMGVVSPRARVLPAPAPAIAAAPPTAARELPPPIPEIDRAAPGKLLVDPRWSAARPPRL